MTFWEFWDAHWFLAWCALWLVWSIPAIVCLVVRVVFRFITRVPMVLLRGWPPAHLNADGGWGPETEENDEASRSLG